MVITKIIIKNIWRTSFNRKIQQNKKVNEWNKLNDLIYINLGNTARKRFDDFNNGIERLEKIKSGEMKLEEAKKLQKVFQIKSKRSI